MQIVCLFGFNVAFNIICHITTVSGYDRELNAHFYSAASLLYQIPDTFTLYHPPVMLFLNGRYTVTTQRTKCLNENNTNLSVLSCTLVFVAFEGGKFSKCHMKGKPRGKRSDGLNI